VGNICKHLTNLGKEEGASSLPLKKVYMENFTVFETVEMDFCDGLNVFIGDNGTGKTHVMKLLYAACQAAQVKSTAVDFPQKIVRVFRPSEFNIGRLVSRKVGNSISKIRIESDTTALQASFDRRTKRWDAEVTGMQAWERQHEDLRSTFIPAKEILSNARNLVQAIDKGNVDFDDTYKDIISAASVDVSRGPDTDRKKRYLGRLQGITHGRVRFENEEFYMLPTGQSQSKLEFHLVAEGLRKIALLWQLIKNGTLEQGAILFWDEPDANINPRHIPDIVDLLLELQRDGVQIFIATHDYFLAKYLEARINKSDEIKYHALYKSGNSVRYEWAKEFALLENNEILKQSINLYKEEVRKVME